MAPKRSKPSRERSRARRERLRRIEFWLPDVGSPAFAAEAHRQSLAVARSRQARADQDFIDAISKPASGIE